MNKADEKMRSDMAISDTNVSRAKYSPTIGLEIHAELKTSSKMFCSCKNDPDTSSVNINICPICLGHPGTLPVLNHEAIRHVLRIGVAVGGTFANFTEWDRKQYFYPDIPKGYQISQYAYPLISGGVLAGIDLERIHLEEDTAQSTHDTHEKSLINFNRSGVPLMELVTKPVIHDAKSAVKFARELRLLLRYLGAGDANMEKGEMRVEANISVSKIGNSTDNILGTKTEVKNLNSFRSVEKAIEYEIDRQISLLENGDVVVQETRGWNDKKSETYSQRSKESAHDYRYFPDPDIPKMNIKDIPEFDRTKLQKELPELPWIKRKRYMNQFKATEKEADVFVEDVEMSKYFDDIIARIHTNGNVDPKSARLMMNYFLTDYLGALKEADCIGKYDLISPANWQSMLSMIMKNEISSRGAKELIRLMTINQGATAHDIALKHSLIQQNDPIALEKSIDAVIQANGNVVDEYRAGKNGSINFLVGKVMKEIKGNADPVKIMDQIRRKLPVDK